MVSLQTRHFCILLEAIPVHSGRGYRVVSLDNLSTRHRDAVLGGEFVLGDLAGHA